MKNKKRATVQYRKPTRNQTQAAVYNYRTTVGEKPARTREEAKGYIEGYTDGLNECERAEKTGKIRTPKETAKLMEKRYSQDRGGEDRIQFDQQAPTYDAPY